MNLTGNEGDVVTLHVSCPKGYQEPPQPLAVVLRRFVSSKRVPEYDVECRSLFRSAMVAVRAKNGAQIPIRHLGQEVAKTDAQGAAHVLLETRPQDTIEIVLDTSEHPGLRPRNPSERFRVGDRDAWFVMDLAFEAPPPAKTPKSTSPRIVNLRARR